MKLNSNYLLKAKLVNLDIFHHNEVQFSLKKNVKYLTLF